MDKQRLNYLVEKYTAGTIDDIEKRELLDLYDSISHQEIQYPDERQTVEDRMLQRLSNEIDYKKSGLFKSRWGVIAAAIIFLVLSATVYLLKQPKGNQEAFNNHSRKKELIRPGTNMAVLTLGNGKKIALSAAISGRLATQGNTIVSKNAAGRIVYLNANDQAGSSQKEKISYNTVTTPAGGQFQITLPDGTDVWLNAASSLKYPSRFEGLERHVELTGEAYFEVFKDKNMPFTVTANNVNIKVLGTHFNVMAYENEPATKTTLLEGSVTLNSGHAHALLTPGIQAVVNPLEDNILLQKVNVEDAIAWKNGYFSFRKENLKTVMNKVARWYDVKIEFMGNPNNKMLGGTVSRAENIDELLDYLELTGVAKFKIEGRRIIVICK